MPSDIQNRVDQLNHALASGEYETESVPCVICHTHSAQRLFANDRYGIHQLTVCCKNCGLVFGSPRLNAESTRRFYASDFYREIYSEKDYTAWAEQRYQRAEMFTPDQFSAAHYHPFSFLDFLKTRDITFASVYEIGAGCGANLVPFRKSGIQIAGCEYSPHLIAEAHKRDINLTQGSIETLAGCFDLGIMIHVFEHILDPVAFLRQMRKHVAYLLIEVPGIVNRIPSLQNAHAYYYSPNTLRYILASAGFAWIDGAHFPENDYLFALCKNSDAVEPFTYNFSDEVRHVKTLVRAFQIRQRKTNLSKALQTLGIHRPIKALKNRIWPRDLPGKAP